MTIYHHVEVTLEDWFSVGKEDAWLGCSKQPPEVDPEAASLYDLGYSEGTIQRVHPTFVTLTLHPSPKAGEGL